MITDGKTAIVTGGASGLGAAVARNLTAAGVKVAIFDFNEDAGQDIATELGARFHPVDVTLEASVEEGFAAAIDAFGTPQILVNCAGIAPPSKVVGRDGSPQPLEEFTRVVSVNLLGTFNVVSKFAARLCLADTAEEEKGVIVNTASVAAFEGQIGQAAYAASKAGVVAMALPIARELARYGIRINTIAPGLFLTPMLESLPQEAQRSLGAQVPFPSRLGKPSEFADLVRAIISNPMLNGEIIRLDGAIRMQPK